MSLDAAAVNSFSHTGKLGDVIGLAAKNAALSVITLTLYRFWARTAMRRRIWSRVWLMDDPLEYTGVGIELFRGFLISLPCFFLPAIFVYYIAPLAMEPVTAGFLAFAFSILAPPLMAAARYWMRRYQLSRTRWRGVKLGLAGSAWTFAWASTGWSVLQGLTLGWYTPVARMKRAQMLWENARFGDQPFSFADGEYNLAKGLWGPFALGWFAIPLAVVSTALVAGFLAAMLSNALGVDLAGQAGNAVDPQTMIIFGAAMTVSVLVLMLLFWTLFWTPYNAAAMNRIASLIELDGARFQLRAKTWSLFGVTLLGWLIIIFSLGLLIPVAGMLQVRYVFNRLEIIGTPRFAEIGQGAVDDSKAGESLGDAFDLDLGVGMI